MNKKNVCKKCNKPLPKGNKYNICEHCLSENVDLGKKILKGVAAGASAALSIVGFVMKRKR